MASPEEIAQQVASAPTWNSRVGLIRRVPEDFGLAQHQAVYARIAEQVYVPHLKPDFAYIHWRPEYELPAVERAYEAAHEETDGFTAVRRPDLVRAIRKRPLGLQAFRLLLGLTQAEFAEASAVAAEEQNLTPVSKGPVASIEAGCALGHRLNEPAVGGPAS